MKWWWSKKHLLNYWADYFDVLAQQQRRLQDKHFTVEAFEKSSYHEGHSNGYEAVSRMLRSHYV